LEMQAMTWKGGH